ncbi:MAG: hypothetical protein GF355_00150, partial [Candidatus Eisenbacteria bacterium]|nr:hypothetical protein [Candidatus Eisenbacteria bacterium]
AGARRLPSIGTQARYTFVSEVLELDLDLPLPDAPPSIRFGDEHRYELSLGLQAPLYTGGRLSATARARSAGAMAAAHDVAADSLRVVMQTRAAFYRALGAAAEAQAALVAVGRLQRRLIDIEAEITAGTGVEEARLQVRARLAEAEQRELAAVERLETALLALGELVGRPGERIKPQGELDRSLLQHGALEALSPAQRPELDALTARHRMSEAMARSARAAFYPSLNLGARASYGRPGVDLIANDWMSWGTAEVSLHWTVWDWGARSDEAQQAQAAERATAAQRSAAARRFREVWEAARVRLRSTQRQLDKAEERVALERERMRLVSGRWRQGMASETELLDAHDDLAAAEAAAAAMRARLRLAEVELLFASGR